MLDDYYDDPFQNFQYLRDPNEDQAGGTTNYQPEANPFDQALQYYQAQRNPVEASAFWSPNDPTYQAYRKRSSETPASEGILRNYLSSMPTHEQYEPGTGRKIAGFLLGTLSGLNNPALAAVNAKKFVDDPYNDAFSEWKNQGSNVQLQARLADSARTRDIASLKEGMLNDYKAKKAADVSNRGGQRIEGTNARNYVGAAQGERRLSDADERQAFLERRFREMQDDLQADRERKNDQRQQQLDRLQAALDDRENNPRGSTKVLTQDERIRKQAEDAGFTSSYADDKGTIKHYDTRELATQLALQQASKDPAWRDIITQDEEGHFNSDFTSERGRLLKIRLKPIVDNLLRGQQ